MHWLVKWTPASSPCRFRRPVGGFGSPGIRCWLFWKCRRGSGELSAGAVRSPGLRRLLQPVQCVNGCSGTVDAQPTVAEYVKTPFPDAGSSWPPATAWAFRARRIWRVAIRPIVVAAAGRRDRFADDLSTCDPKAKSWSRCGSSSTAWSAVGRPQGTDQRPMLTAGILDGTIPFRSDPDPHCIGGRPFASRAWMANRAYPPGIKQGTFCCRGHCSDAEPHEPLLDANRLSAGSRTGALPRSVFLRKLCPGFPVKRGILPDRTWMRGLSDRCAGNKIFRRCIMVEV